MDKSHLVRLLRQYERHISHYCDLMKSANMHTEAGNVGIAQECLAKAEFYSDLAAEMKKSLEKALTHEMREEERSDAKLPRPDGRLR